MIACMKSRGILPGTGPPACEASALLHLQLGG